MTKRRQLLLGGAASLTVVMGVLAAVDPRAPRLQSIATELTTLRDAAPVLPENVKGLISHAVQDLQQAAGIIPPTPSPDPEPGSGECGESMVEWHAPVVNGCATGHEHGDAPPEWAQLWSRKKFGHGVIYGGDETSSAAENSHKHTAFKGITAKSVAGGDVYMRYHAASNPMDRSARYHSYEFYYRDTAGNVSFWQGWYDTGDPERSRVLRRVPALAAENQRPIILVPDETSFEQRAGFEQWYAHAAAKWSWDMGIAIGNATTYYRRGENATAMDMDTWVPTGDMGLTRRADGFWYIGREGGGTTLVGDFCGTATGKIVDCMEPGALAQYIAPTARNDARNEFGTLRVGFLIQKQFPGQGVRLPN